MTALQTDKTGRTFMIVEDEALVAVTLRDALEDVLNPTDRNSKALDLAKAGKPDLALVNIRLAGGDDGFDLAENLKSLGMSVHT